MRVIFAATLLIGIGLAVFAVNMAQNYIGAYQSALAEERSARSEMIGTVDVVVTQNALRYGVALSKDDLKIIKWPKDALPEGVFQTMEEIFPEGDHRKRFVVRAMEPNEALMTIKVTELGQDAGLTSRLKRGQRAFTINVNVATGVSGFLRPSDRVDVYWTGTIPGEDGDVTKLIEPGIDLIAIDQIVDQDLEEATIARTVTVAVDPQKVATLAQAQSSGRLPLSLVGAQDDTIAQAIEVDQRALLGMEEIKKPEVVVEAPKEKVCTIKTRRGSEVVIIDIPCTN